MAEMDGWTPDHYIDRALRSMQAVSIVILYNNAYNSIWQICSEIKYKNVVRQVFWTAIYCIAFFALLLLREWTR